jgi:hypothetical protein
MSSWTNKDLYVAYGFGSSTVDGYYFPDTTENHWKNSSNNVSLIYGGTHWWLVEKTQSTYLHYYYGAEDSGSGICDDLVFASNAVYGVCSGEFPIGGVIYGGAGIESSSSSSSSQVDSSSSSSYSSSSSIDSSSSSSTSFGFSSSSSSSHIQALELFQTLVHQGHYDIIPFSYIIERGQAANSTIGFTFASTANTISYSNLLSFNTVSSMTADTFVPESPEAKYKHEPIFYVDLIVEGHGVSDYSLRSQKDFYTKEKPTMTFNIPKFSWDNSIFGYIDESESSTDFKEGYVWMGTNNNQVAKVSYTMESSNVVSINNVSSEVHKIAFSQKDSRVFISCYDNLLSYTATTYYNSSADNFHAEANILNENWDLIQLDNPDDNYALSTQAYQGNVIIRDRDTLMPIRSVEGFDAPFKAAWSKAHNCYLVAGTNTLWKLDGNKKTAAYNIKGYSIVDFDCSEKGVVGIIFKGSDNYIVRFVDKNLYTILYNESISDKNARYCRYCEQGKFYVLLELSSEDTYSTVSYLFDSISKSLAITEATSSIVTTTTTTTLPVPTHKVEITTPIEGGIWQKGTKQQIEWLSNASVNDVVKIELYKGFKLVDTLAEETPNTGIFVWQIPSTLDDGNNYKIKITWLSAGDDTNYDVSGAFTLTNVPQTEAETPVEKIYDKAIGVEYNRSTGQIIVVLSNGQIGVYDLSDYSFNGLFESGISDVTCIAVRDRKVRKFNAVSQVRVYVGSLPRLSDKWDSGVITTDLTSMYYGGGNNLTPGAKYYVNIQVYSDKYGWSGVQTKEFIMPK